MNPDTLKLILAGVAGALAMFAPKIWEKIKPFWPKAQALVGLGPLAKGNEEEVDELEGLDAYSLHEIVEYLIVDRKAARDSTGVTLVGTLGKHLYDLRLEEKK